MTILRRVFDPLLSRRFFSMVNSARLLQSQSLSIHIRLDDPYSYLLTQTLAQLIKILAPTLKPIRLVIYNNLQSPQANAAQLAYSLNDASVLASQHGFSFPDRAVSASANSQLTNANAVDFYTTHLTAEHMALAADLIQYYSRTLTLDDFCHQLQQVLGMVWHGQHNKLMLLHGRIDVQTLTQPIDKSYTVSLSDLPLAAAYFGYAGQHYAAIDDLLRLTRRLHKEKLLTGEPIFLMNHLEWGEHLVSDPVILSHIQASNAVLDVYVALEDPFSWLILQYLQKHIAGYYKVKVVVYPLSYQGKDHFDWRKAVRLSKRVKVPYTPFCRPTQLGAQLVAQLLYPLDPVDRLEALLWLQQQIWSQGKDISASKHYKAAQAYLMDNYNYSPAMPEQVQAWVQHNTQQWQQLNNPLLPTMQLHLPQHTISCGGIYRVWRIETELAASEDRHE